MARPLIRSLLVVVDGTDSAVAAADYAIQLARAGRAAESQVAASRARHLGKP